MGIIQKMSTAETPEQRAERFRQLRESIANQLLEKYPEVTLNRHQYGIDVIYYVARFHDKVYIGEQKRGINNTVFSLDRYFLTREQAQRAIEKHLPAARHKFNQCLAAFNQLKQSMDFDVSYSIEGDTHGIEDYPYISFKLEGFDFTFRIDG